MIKKTTLLLIIVLLHGTFTLHAQFVHPGGTHTLADLDRMKAKVTAKEKPWIDGWNTMISNSKAQNTYVAKPTASISGADGVRQQAARDACAAYFNTLRWYVTGDASYADCAVRILNAWSTSINTVVTGELFQLPIYPMVQAGELLRIYPGWAASDFSRFKNMCLNYFYPACQSFRNSCGTWPGWDGPANTDMLAIAVLCDDSVKYKDAINYYKTGAGGGGFYNTFCQPSGQVSEMGRDQPHAEIGPGFAAQFCQIAWNQGTDLFSFADNRLLAGFEYFSKFNLNHPVVWVPYNDCNNHNFMYLSQNGAGTISHSPDYELVYHHYVDIKGMKAPYTRAMINLRGIIGQNTNDDYIGYYGLTYAKLDTTTLYTPKPIPAAPTNLKATAGSSLVNLEWTGPSGDVANGYTVYRSTSLNGTYTTIATWTGNTFTRYEDASVNNGTTYYYKVAANNQSGVSGKSNTVLATPVASTSTLPVDWNWKDIGTVAVTGSATYANIGDRTFSLIGSGTDVGGTADSHGYIYTSANGDFTLTARLKNTMQNPDYAKIKIGLIVRETLSANSRKFVLNLGDVQQRYLWFSYRTTTSGGTSWTQGNSHTWVPVWMRLKRVGNTFTGYQSSDGVTWFQVGSATGSLSTATFAGFFVCGGTTATDFTASAVFDRVTLTGGGKTVAVAPANVSGSAANSGRINLQWTASASALNYEIKRSTSVTGPFECIAPVYGGTAFSDSGLVANTSYTYSIKAVNFTGNSPDSSVVTVQTPGLNVPNAPTGLKTICGNLSAELAWNNTDETTGYYVKRASSASGPYTTLATVSTLTYSDKAVTVNSTYYYKVCGYNSMGEGLSSEPISLTVIAPAKLTGTSIGTAGSYNNNSATTKDAALDGNLGTYFDSTVGTGAWVGWDLGETQRATVAKVRFAPRSGYPGRMTGGQFQGANSADFSDATTLYTVVGSPSTGSLTEKEAFSFKEFRYLRYLCPTDGWGNVAEVEFWGRKFTLPVALTNPSQDETCSLWLNPVSKALHLSLPATNSEINVRILDIQGRSIRSKTLSPAEPTIDVNALPQGLYVLMIQSGSKNWVRKFVR
jgi:fibronectin type 3 domain-containing protein